jgi:hypothetical protein
VVRFEAPGCQEAWSLPLHRPERLLDRKDNHYR